LKLLTGAPQTVTADEQAGFARQARELSSTAAKTSLPEAYRAHLDRLRTGAQR
jgi:hypothetical protein